jgi:transposase InsO family protein
VGLGDARQIVEDWRQDYNADRPHSALAHQTPEQFRRELARRPLAAQEVAPR